MDVRDGKREYRWTMLAGWAGILGALGWIVGDIFIVGHVAAHEDFPLLFQDYAGQIDVGLAEVLVGVPRLYLIVGALAAIFTVPFYLIGCWHLWRGVRTARRGLALPAIILIAFGYATSPLPHAAFYFLGAVYQTIPLTDVSAHPQLLALAEEFRQVLSITYVPSVASSALGLILFSLAVASGRSAYPRWFALTANPLLVLVTVGVPDALGGTMGHALAGAGLNTLWLLVYAQSLVLLKGGAGSLK